MKPFEVLSFPPTASFRLFSSIYGFMPVVPVGAVCFRWVTFAFFLWLRQTDRHTCGRWPQCQWFSNWANNQVTNVMWIKGCVIVFWFWKVSRGEIQSSHLTLLHTERLGADFWSDFVIDTIDLSTRTLRGSFLFSLSCLSHGEKKLIVKNCDGN